MKEIKYLETGSTNPYFNLSFEEYILCNKSEYDYIILWQNDNTIVVGQNQNTEAEINRNFVEENKINVVRRSTGGGAVYHDMGNLNYSFITDAGDAETMTIDRFVTPVVDALKKLGLNAEASGRNDILIDGFKVSGTAQRLYKSRILHHGTLLFDSNPEMIAGALNADSGKFISKSAKSVRSRIGNIRDHLVQDMSIEEFRMYLRDNLPETAAKADKLSDEEIAKVNEIKKSKYDTWEWNYARSPKYDMQNKRRFAGGALEVRMSVEKGIIKDIMFIGDFMSLCDLNDITCVLKEKPLKSEIILSILSKFKINEYFGTITIQEVMDTIFNAE